MIDATTYTLPTWALPALFNGDVSGLTDEEVKQIDDLERAARRAHGVGHWSYNPEDEPYFSWHNDLDNLGADVQAVDYVVVTPE